MSASVDEILGEATRFEKEYEWLQASDLYEQALGMVDEGDYFRRGEIQEKIGHSLQRAAFQAGSREEFEAKMRQAIRAYNAARGLYERSGDENAAWMLRCGALSSYLSHWLASDPSEKRRHLDDSMKLEENAMMVFWNLGNKLEYGRTYNELSLVFWHRAHREWDSQVRRKILEEGISWGEKAVAVLTELGDSYEIARAYITMAFCWGVYRIFFEDLTRGIEIFIEHLRKAVEFSERVGDAYLIGLSYIGFSYWAVRFEEEPVPYLEKALKYGEETRDNYLKSLALDYLAYQTYWKAIGTEDPDQRRKLADEAMEFYDRAHHKYSLISHQLSKPGGKTGAPPPGGHAEYYLDRAGWEIDPNMKLEFLEKSEKAGLEALIVAEKLDVPIFISRMSHIFSRTLAAQARVEPEIDVKRSLLENALKHRERNIEIFERISPFHYYNIGTYRYLLAVIKAELAYIQPDLDVKRRLLEDAAVGMESSFNIFKKNMPFTSPDLYSTLWGYQDGYGVILTHLYEATKNPEYLGRAIAIWLKAIESAGMLDMATRIAESHWKIARAQGVLGEHKEAAESFDLASESYMNAAEKIPQLREFYQELASYMNAWSEIERAKRHHLEKRYGKAREHYEKAAELHSSTERWNYLAPNYQAWARLNEAEDISRNEETEKARDLFQQAVELFSETEDSIKSKLNTIDVGEERQIAEELIKASDVRREYCLGRVALEEARILDRQGDHSASSRRYKQATVRFRKVIDAMKRESDKKELLPIIKLCQAWEKMMLAEEEMSSRLYREAAGLFMEAREHALDQKTRLLAQAHSSFCNALEVGTEFEETRDIALFSEAKRYIEAATSYYLRAGYRSSSNYATATNRLLDGYMYTYNAQMEMNPERKARLYQMAERLLQDSAGLFLKAKHPEKSDEVRTILENIRGEKEIALSLAQLMHVPTIMQTTSSFSTPTPTHEQAVGLERFENADIQANFIVRRREVGVGEDLDLE
ncbi:MAG: hypothetical protein NWE76_00805, partial [Candidatus Bathyarchaeota archaeon]|nr:hypothetical protein [Candidatus Bathyarchaeota archaeon]